MIIVNQETIAEVAASKTPQQVSFVHLDEDVYTSIVCRHVGEAVKGIIKHYEGPHTWIEEDSDVVVLITGDGVKREMSVFGRVRAGMAWIDYDVEVVSVQGQLYSRARGLIETRKLTNKSVAFVGVGSFGSTIAPHCAQSGVGTLILIDPERVAVENVMRHRAGVSDIGRFKTNVMSDVIQEKNPDAKVETFEMSISHTNADVLRDIVRQCDLVIATPDSELPKRIVNRLCVEEGVPLIISGAYPRAYGGQVLCVEPNNGPCYECFLSVLPPEERTEVVRNDSGIAYSNGPVVVEPGLSIDIAPMCSMVAKLGLQRLLRGMPTALRSLDEDLNKHLYIWLNRRESGTQYEHLEPLGDAVDGLRILRWYGIGLDRNPHCSVCGDATPSLVEQRAAGISEQDLAAFRAGIDLQEAQRDV